MKRGIRRKIPLTFLAEALTGLTIEEISSGSRSISCQCWMCSAKS
jgi:hypothetical protein